jgi:hypothetical protein
LLLRRFARLATFPAVSGEAGARRIARQRGYAGLLPAVGELATRYLGELLERISA